MHERLVADHWATTWELEPVDQAASHPIVHGTPADTDSLDSEVNRHKLGFFLAVFTEKVRPEQMT